MLDIIKTFLRIGFTSFGGPLVAFALVEEEVVNKKKWMSLQEFSKALAIVKILPGPTATQLVLQVVRLSKGKLQAFIAGLCFLLPSFVCILTLGIFLNSLAQGANKENFESGMAIAALALIIQSIVRLFKNNIKNTFEVFIAFFCGCIVLMSQGLEPVLIISAGMLGVAISFTKNKKLEGSVLVVLIFLSLKAALFSFGTGLAIVPLLKTTVVDQLKLISDADFMEALVLGQVTPGPVIMTMSWVGYKSLGMWGALITLFFIFAPGFIICLFLMPVLENKFLQSPRVEHFYNYAIAAVVGSMVAITLKLCYENIQSPVAASIFLTSCILVFYKNVPSWFIIPFFGLVSFGLNKIPFHTWTF